MSKSSIFSSSDSYYSLLVNQIYSSLMTGEWCSHASELAKFNGISEDDVKKLGKKSLTGYGELKKAFTDVLKAIKEKHPDSLEEVIYKKEKKVRYVGSVTDPFAEERSNSRQQTIEDYARFCRGSLGLLPPGWFASFFEGTQQMGDARKEVREGNVFIGATHEQNLKNIDLLPQFYRHIDRHEATSFSYATYGKEPIAITFHPQYIKEFNGRWFVIGPKEGSEHPVDVIPLDRIRSAVEIADGNDYIPAKPGFYQEYFKNIVGVTHEAGCSPINIVIKTRSRYIHGLMNTKPIHSSFVEIKPYFKYEDDKFSYGLISYYVEPNREFIGRILTFGPDLEIVSPDSIRNKIRDKVKKLSRIYGIIGSEEEQNVNNDV